MHRIRWTTHPHRPAPPDVRRGATVDRPHRLRGRHRRHQPPARPGLHPAGHLLCLAAAGDGRGHPGRDLLHRPGAGPHSGSLGRVPVRASTSVGARCRGRCRSSGSRRGPPRRLGSGTGQPAPYGEETGGEAPVDGLRPGGRASRRQRSGLFSSSSCWRAAGSRSSYDGGGDRPRREGCGPWLPSGSCT